jgi:hypothetical protein
MQVMQASPLNNPDDCNRRCYLDRPKIMSLLPNEARNMGCPDTSGPARVGTCAASCGTLTNLLSCQNEGSAAPTGSGSDP